MRRAVTRTVLIIAGLITALLLATFGLVIWELAVDWPAALESKSERESARERVRSIEAVERLGMAAGDGKLTVREVSDTVGLNWTSKRTSKSISVIAYFSGGFGNEKIELCVRYTVGLPLGPATSVTRTELPRDQGPCRGLRTTYVETTDPDEPIAYRNRTPRPASTSIAPGGHEPAGADDRRRAQAGEGAVGALPGTSRVIGVSRPAL